MRIGEIKQIVDQAVTDAGQVLVQSEAVYGGQAYLVRNYKDLMDMLAVLDSQKWNDLDYAPIKSIAETHSTESLEAQLSQTEYTSLTNYIAQLNGRLPIFTGLLDSIVSNQDEQTINIKLPTEIQNLDELNKIDNSLAKLLKEFVIDGGVKFVGFDSGSSWLVVCLVGVETYRVFIGCLQIAQEYFKAKTEYSKSSTARVEYKAAMRTFNIESDPEKEKEYVQTKMNLEVEEKIDELLKKVDDAHGKSEPELRSTIIKATQELIKELGNNVEFHLSLNPPSYAREVGNELKIDYVQMDSLRAETSSIKKIQAKVEDPIDEGKA